MEEKRTESGRERRLWILVRECGYERWSVEGRRSMEGEEGRKEENRRQRGNERGGGIGENRKSGT